ncbi:MAG: GNAT family N-acetyltransferase [Deltaproteobacteria bacterium]|nr:GNAT family N-acetyltransferase [Deltaproteobacteria bacterium]
MKINLIKAETDEHINMARTLFLEYEKELGINLCFQNFKNELKNLPCKYAEPAGALLIAENKFKNPAGCVALKKLSANGICEIKRLFVKPDCRTKGVGVKLISAIIDIAVKKGYLFMRLDTLASLKKAIKLYDFFGFKKIAPYYNNPIKNAVYMELNLEK